MNKTVEPEAPQSDTPKPAFPGRIILDYRSPRQRRYVPVAAKRNVLSYYRYRRQEGASPVEAMDKAVQFYSGHLAHFVAFDEDHPALDDMLTGYRAAVKYRRRLDKETWAHRSAERCACGKPIEHLNAPEDSADWSCRVPLS